MELLILFFPVCFRTVLRGVGICWIFLYCNRTNTHTHTRITCASRKNHHNPELIVCVFLYLALFSSFALPFLLVVCFFFNNEAPLSAVVVYWDMHHSFAVPVVRQLLRL